MNAEDAATLLYTERCALFLGSGVSIPAPSSLPSAAKIVRRFLERIAEGVVSKSVVDALAARSPLPEYVYGTVERFFGPDVYDVWRSLDLWRSYGDSFSANAGHIAAADVSARHSAPILTTNFDSYFEDAAQMLGLRSTVTVAAPGEPFRPAPTQPGDVSIWKLHGTAGDPSTVFSSVRTLTSPISGLAEAIYAAIPPNLRLVLAGYSGRDLDLFPLIRARPRLAHSVWVDLAFPEDHRSRFLTPEPALVLASFDVVGRAYADLVGGQVRKAVDTADERAGRLVNSLRVAALADDIDAHIDSIAVRFDDVDRRILVFAELLVNAGLLTPAEQLLESAAMSGVLESERLRLHAKALWELGRFRSSREVAVGGLKRRNGSAAERDVLGFARSVANLRILVAPRDLSGTRRTSPWRLSMVALLSAWLLIKGSRRIRAPKTVPEPTRSAFVDGYLEHAIRVLLALQFATTRSNGTVPRAWRNALARGWRRAHRASILAGYAEGVGNSDRYLARLGVAAPGGVRAAHEFLGHTLGMAIAHRDASQRALQQGRVAEAKRRFDRGYALAMEQADPVLLLTFVPLSEALGNPVTVPDELVTSIEAPWAEEHLRWRGSR